MENSKLPAFPRVAFDQEGNITAWDPQFTGISKREYFIGQALVGLSGLGGLTNEKIAIHAMKIADIVIKNLEE